MRPDRLVQDHPQRRGRREESAGQVGGDGVGGVGRQVDEAAFGDDERGQGRLDVWELRRWGGIMMGRGGRVERAQVDGVDVVGRGVEAGGGEGERGGDEVLEELGRRDGGDFRPRDGGEIELVVNERGDGGMGCCQPEEARVGAGAERDDLFFDRGEGGEEECHQPINRTGADICSYLFCRIFLANFSIFYRASFLVPLLLCAGRKGLLQKKKKGQDIPRLIMGNLRVPAPPPPPPPPRCDDRNSFANGSSRYPASTALTRDTLASSSVPRTISSLRLSSCSELLVLEPSAVVVPVVELPIVVVAVAARSLL